MKTNQQLRTQEDFSKAIKEGILRIGFNLINGMQVGRWLVIVATNDILIDEKGYVIYKDSVLDDNGQHVLTNNGHRKSYLKNNFLF